MIKILNNHCNTENGLLLFDPPTGSGKTYNVLKWIFENYKQYCKEGRKIFFITNLKKNLPVDDLKNDFFIKNKKAKDFYNHVLFLNSNSGFVLDNFETVKDEIPEYFSKLSVYWNLKNQVELINRYNDTGSFKDILKKAKNELRIKQEPEFRKRIELYLKENYANKRDRIKAIKTDKDLQWIGKLYPSVFSSERKIIFLSIDKFYAQNSTIVEPSYHFINNDISKDAIVFIDEVDATKDSILKNIIKQGKKQKIDYVHLFNEIFWALSNNKLPRDFIEHSKKRQRLIDEGYKYLPLQNIEEELRLKAEEIVKKFKISYSFKTAEAVGLSRERNLLFHDFHYHSVYRNDKKFIEIDSNEFRKMNHLIFTNDKPSDRHKNVVTLLNQIKGFISYFKGAVKSLANNYQETINERRTPTGSEYDYDLALSSVLEEFRLEGRYKLWVMDSILAERERTNPRERKKEEILYDFSFYENGFRYYDFIDDEQHETITKTYIYEFFNTPEKFLLKLAERAKVIGISATARVETVTGNYDIGYLKKQLGVKFIELTEEETESLKLLVDRQTQNYEKVQIHPVWVSNTEEPEKIKLGFTELFRGDDEMAGEIIGRIDNSDGYVQSRYLRIATAFNRFIKESSINAMLCLLNKEPKSYDNQLNSNTLEYIFDELIHLHNAKNDFTLLNDDGESTYSVEHSYRIINSADFDTKKENFTSYLENGQKLFLISMYQTMGAGQNLQYTSPDASKLVDIRSQELDNFNQTKTDINAIYLDKPTHLIQLINKKLTEEGFIRYLFQLEFLLEAGRISLKTLNLEVTRAFQNLMASINSKDIPIKSNGELYNDYNIKQHYAKFIIQAIGRICRTNLKAKNIYILADEKLKKEICSYDVDNNIVLREFRALVNSCCENKTEDKDNYQKHINKAIIANGRALAHIRKFIHRQFAWREKEIIEWKQLRELCLRYPTMTQERAKDLVRVLDVYVELSDTGNAYSYHQSSDFHKINIAFENSLDFKVSSQSARLEKLMEIPGVKEHFESKSYATYFAHGKYMLTPVIFHNIYKGALGEVVGRYIFEKHLNIQLEELPKEYFERFDFKVKNKDIYVDFKHWQEYTSFDASTTKEKIVEKLDELNGSKVIIINILAESDYHPIASSDGRIIEIANLYDVQKKTFNDGALTKIIQNV